MVVKGDHPRTSVFSRLTKKVGVNAPENTTEILRDDKVVLAALEFSLSFSCILAVKALAAAGTSDHCHLERDVAMQVKPIAVQGFLILETLFRLVRSTADTGDTEYP